MEQRTGLVTVDDEEERQFARMRHVNLRRSLETLWEMRGDFVERGEPADPEGYEALCLAIDLGEIELYTAAGPAPHIYNVWDFARRERVEVHEWLAQYGGEHVSR